MEQPVHEHLSLLLKVNEVLNSSLSTQDVMRDLICQVIESLGAERGFIVLRKHQDWQVLATHYVDPSRAVADRYFSRTIVTNVAESGQPKLCVDALKTSKFGSIVIQGIRSILCAPLRWSGKVQGVVYADSSVKAGQFNDTHLAIFTAIADQASRNLENKALQERLRGVHWQSFKELSIREDTAALVESQASSKAVDFALGVLESENYQLQPVYLDRPTSGVSLSLFGVFQATIDGVLIENWSTRKNRELLAYLAAHRGQLVHEEKLMDLFWSHGGESGLHSLHNGVTQLRKILGSRKAIERRLDGYCLSAAVWVDIERFTTAFDAGRLAAGQGFWAEALPLLSQAERLAGAEFMEGCYSDWTFPFRQRLEEQVKECREILASHFSERGKHLIAIELWKRVLQIDRCYEQAYRGLMEAYRALARWSEIRRTYEVCERAFQEDLDLSVPEGLREFLEFE